LSLHVPAAYSPVFRRRVVGAVQSGRVSVAEAARRYEIDRATIWRWLTQLSATGSIEPAPHAGGRRPRISGPYAAILVDLATTRADATQEELAGLLESRTGLSVSASTVSRALTRLGVER
jgi:transposase